MLRIALSGCALSGALIAAAAPRQDARVDGEYGLSVRFAGDSLVVQWLTSAEVPGSLRVESGSRVDSFTTPGARAHRVALPRPRRDSVMLQYGSTVHGSNVRTPVFLNPPRRPPATVPAADSIYVVGDTHGDFDTLVAGLQRAGLIDRGLHWTGGRKHLVFAGDLTDRGPDVTRLLWFVYALERAAARRGGRVHVVLGNHETMVMLGDLRYVHQKEQQLAQLHGIGYYRIFDPRHSILGRWLVSKPALIRIGRVAITHGGVTPEYAHGGVRSLDETLARYTGEDLFYYWADTTAVIPIDSASYVARENFFWSSRSVFWHRAYVQSDTTTAELVTALDQLDADVLVVGHTAVPVISALHDGRLLAVHTARHGGELLLLVRDRNTMRRYRITESGTEPF